VESGWQDIGQAGQIPDFFHRVRLIRKFQQVEIRVGHHHVVGLPADPSAHIDISIGAAGAVGIDVKADAGVALSTGTAAAACDVERDRYQVADLEILDVAAFLDHLAGDLVSEHHAGRRCRAPPDHVLVGTADIRRYDLEDDGVVDRLSCRIAEGGKVDLLNFDGAGFEVNHAAIGIGRHLLSPVALSSFRHAEFFHGRWGVIRLRADLLNQSRCADGKRAGSSISTCR
jgi:hypothetical protein